jgi:hypothetical protein
MQAEEFFSVVTNQEPARNLLKDVAEAIYVPLLRARQFTVTRRVVGGASGVVYKKRKSAVTGGKPCAGLACSERNTDKITDRTSS